MKKRRSLPEIRPVFREFHDITASRVHTVHTHQHYDYEMFRAVKGTYRCFLNEEPLAVPQGQLLIIKPGDLHSDEITRPGIRYQAISFYVEEETTGKAFPLFNDQVTLQQQVLSSGKKEMASIFDRIGIETQTSDAYFTRIIQSLMNELFWTIVRNLSPEARKAELELSENQDEHFRKALKQIFSQARNSTALNVDEIATGMNMSRRNLTRRCRQLLGTSPARAFLHYKMTIAGDLLRQTDMSCQEIALYLGFSNQYHFSHAFKRIYTISPLKYREGEDPHGPRLSPFWPK